MSNLLLTRVFTALRSNLTSPHFFTQSCTRALAFLAALLLALQAQAKPYKAAEIYSNQSYHYGRY